MKPKTSFAVVFVVLFVASMFVGLIGTSLFPTQAKDVNFNTTDQSWNVTWRYRKSVTFSETDSLNRTNFPVDVFLTFDTGTCINNSIRVNQTFDSSAEVEIPSQVWNVTYETGTEFIQSATVTFLINVPGNEEANFSIYYSDAPDPFPVETYDSFASTLSTTQSGNQVTVANDYYIINFDDESGVYNFTIKNIDQNFHTNLSLAPTTDQNRYQGSQYVMVRAFEHLLFIAKEEGTIRYMMVYPMNSLLLAR